MRAWFRCLVLAATSCVLAGCANASEIAPGASGPTGDTDAPTHVRLTCGVDGSTSLSSGAVQAQSDGVHLVIVNEYDEPVSVGGFDADRGTSDWVLPEGPGTVDLSCWPFSHHGSGEDPLRVELAVVDPEGYYVDGALACENVAGMIGDSFDLPVDEGPPPLDVARDLIDGLRDDDVVMYAGYRDQEARSVVVSRDGEIVATFAIAKFEGESWVITGYSVCEGSDLPSQASG